MNYTLKTIAAGSVAALAATVSLAQSYYLAGDFQSPVQWQAGTTPMTAGPNPGEYSYTITGGTPGNYANAKVTDGTWNNSWPGDGNVTVLYDATGSVTIHFWPGSFTDGWQPLSNRVGYDDPGNDPGWGVAGDFNGWDGTQTLLAAQGGGVYSNTTVVATAQTFGFKFQSPAGNWSDSYFGADFGNGGNDGTYTTTNASQIVPMALDLPNGRFLIGGLAPGPVTNQVVFAVDMSAQLLLGNFNPAVDTVFASGSFNGWPGTGPGALVLTNYPPYQGGSNTNIYYGTNIVVDLPGANYQYKFTCNDSAYSGNSGYEPVSNNRQFDLLPTSSVLSLPLVSFGNANMSDYLTTPVNVTFTVNMTNATSFPDGHVFDPQTDYVFINGNFFPGGWSAWNPIALTAMNNDPLGSSVYTYTATLPAASLINLQYKYGMGYSGVTNYDNEAAAYLNHDRYIRMTATGAYTNAMDTYGNQYNEPVFGQLTSAQAGPGMVAVSWLGRPGIQLQVTTNVAGGWQNVVATDGTNWVTGSMSTNGFVSQTNLPASAGQQYFRLQQAW